MIPMYCYIIIYPEHIILLQFIQMCIYMYIYIHICIHIYIRRDIHANLVWFQWTAMLSYTWNTWSFSNSYKYAYIYTYIYTYIYIHIYIRRDIHATYLVWFQWTAILSYTLNTWSFSISLLVNDEDGRLPIYE
jgi:hypothetical protein